MTERQSTIHYIVNVMYGQELLPKGVMQKEAKGRLQ